jgi:hypothetical protein
MKLDSQGAIAASKNEAKNSKIRHLDLKYHFLKEIVEQKMLEVKYVPTQIMKADIMAKALNGTIF